jgi:inosine-uridine nucleoside N-ribohydrolase
MTRSIILDVAEASEDRAMTKVILDCDNTLSVYRSDVDDGLTLMYLYAHEAIDLLGITTTFGNNALHVVHANTRQMLKDLNIDGIPVLIGARTPANLESEAVDYLVDQVDHTPGEIVILATGSLQNLYGAHLKDPDFFEKVKRLIVMGGTQSPVPAHTIPHTKGLIKLASRLTGAGLDELNFSCAPRAAFHVLNNGRNLSLMSTQLTLQAWFGEAEMERIRRKDNPLTHYLVPILERFVDDVYARYQSAWGFFNWDLTTAIYLTNPELFETRPYRAALSEKNLETGLVPEDRDGSAEVSRIIDLPTRIINLRQFNQLFLEKLDVIADMIDNGSPLSGS